jgi:hypothetical protein
MGFVAVWCFGVVMGVVGSLELARRWKQEGKRLRRVAADLILVADSLRRKAHREFEDAKRLKHQAAQLIRETYTQIHLDDRQRIRILQGGKI